MPLVIMPTPRINMKFVKELGLISFALGMSGCTVLGFATDLALLSASDGNETQGDPHNRNGTELFFTQEGLKHDMKAAKRLMDELSVSNHDFTPVFQKDTKSQPLACKNVKDGQQQCYPPEYYKDMYIDNAVSKGIDSKEKEAKPRKD
ncbi:MAG: hypothetical protein ACJAXM_000564 [Arenicella sp.]|jgi:hypothetical protein